MNNTYNYDPYKDNYYNNTRQLWYLTKVTYQEL